MSVYGSVKACVLIKQENHKTSLLKTKMRTRKYSLIYCISQDTQFSSHVSVLQQSAASPILCQRSIERWQPTSKSPIHPSIATLAKPIRSTAGHRPAFNRSRPPLVARLCREILGVHIVYEIAIAVTLNVPAVAGTVISDLHHSVVALADESI